MADKYTKKVCFLKNILGVKLKKNLGSSLCSDPYLLADSRKLLFASVI